MAYVLSRFSHLGTSKFGSKKRPPESLMTRAAAHSGRLGSPDGRVLLGQRRLGARAAASASQ